ncbi:histidine kinase [Brevibacillus parabrevis]|nr:histidine kinase [Brevibacillus parabrevis]
MDGDCWMNRWKYVKFLCLCLAFAIGIVGFFVIYIQTIPVKGSPQAVQGVLDLSKWDFRKQGLVSLDGDWEFYEGQLLGPSDFRNESRADTKYLKVPETWKGKSETGGMSRKGYGTYRLKIIVNSTEEIYGMKLRNIRMSHKLFINGKEEGSSGVPGINMEAHQPGNTPYSTYFHSDTNEIEVIIQVANYMYITGGIVNAIQFGFHHDVTSLNGLQLGTDIGAVIILLILGIYHLNFYFLRTQEKAFLLSGLYVLALLCGQIVYGEKVLLRYFPEISFDFAYKLQDLSVYLSAVIMNGLFYFINKRVMSARMLAVVTAPMALYAVAILVLPYPVHSEYEYVVLMYMELLLIYFIGRMFYLYYTGYQQDRNTKKEMLLFIAGCGCLLIFLTDGILYSENIVPTDLTGKMAVIGFLAFYNLLLAARFAGAFEKTELLTHQLALSNQLKDEFLTNTSHEMKTPLHGILNIASHMLEDEEHTLTAKQKQNLRLVKDTSIKLSMLIHDLIDVTRLKNGQLRLHLTVVDIRVVTQFVFDVLHFELLGKKVRLDNLVPANALVYADENRLRQIMYNLVHNAIKHTERGVIAVGVRWKREKIEIYVEDSGTGIRKENREAIFHYFVQLEQPLPQDGYTGMGVGLYISRKLVEQMGGSIWVDWSEPAMGTRMVFTLPEVTGQELAAQEIAVASEGPERVYQSIDLLGLRQDDHEYTILVVDDEASNVHTLYHILNRHRYNVLTAISAKEAMARLEQHGSVDLVILDVMMPGISGIELCRTLRSQYTILELPILFATVKDTAQDIVLGFRAGANDYVTKPFEADTLIARIKTLLAMKTSIQEAIASEQAFYQAQIKPHFLYNALSSVVSFCYTDGEKAAYLLTTLSQYLRYILDVDRSNMFVLLQREMELVEAYVEIEKARFGDRFDFLSYVDESALQLKVPSLCIQPFVENAIRHGLFEKDGHGQVTLTVREGDGYIQVIVEDNGVGIPDDLLYRLTKGEKQNGSIGISNIRKRLDSISGSSLTFDSELGRGTTVKMLIPIEKQEDRGHMVSKRREGNV